MSKLSVKKGDMVLVIAGKDKNKRAKVLAVSPKTDRVIVEGVNVVSKCRKARTAQEKSQIIKIEAPINASNVMVVCPDCGKATRVAHHEVNGKKARVCKKCGASLDKEFVKEVKKSSKDKSPKPEPAAKEVKEKKVAKKAENEVKTEKKPTAKKTTSKAKTAKKEEK
ncbi:MAG TPA: 50S ribosomal protein L24 [Clostridiales bacterium]|nr:50S ribosomal protein L24 [Clostridiales bacterium]